MTGATDGTRWSALGTGWDYTVRSLSTFDPDGAGAAPPVLVAGGYTAPAGGVAASRIAAWDGTRWWALGTGMNNTVYALTTWDPDGAGPALDSLFAGGGFTLAGGAVSVYLAEWYRPLFCPPGLRASPPWTPLIPACAADFDANGFVDALDLMEFLDRFNAGDATADLNSDGRLDSTDFLEMTTAVREGCP